MINCFTYTFKTLTREGYEFPKEFGEYCTSDLKAIIRDYQSILDKNIHYAYFESFCEYVDEAQKNDIIIHKHGVGIAVNSMMYVTILPNPMRRMLQKIGKGCKVMRIGKE